jgi:transcriptional regulator with XRE-family HTH domain
MVFRVGREVGSDKQATMPSVQRQPRRPGRLDLLVGLNVRMWRIAKDMAQVDLAAGLGITFQQLQKYETGANRIPSGRLAKIAQTLEIPMAALFRGAEESNETGEAVNESTLAMLRLFDDPHAFRLMRAFAAIPDRALRLAWVFLLESLARLDQVEEDSC